MRVLLALALVSAALGQSRSSAPRASGKLNAKDGLTYILVPAGTFSMGCSPGDSECFEWEKPAREATISKAFRIGRTEVTQDAYRRVTGSNPSRYRGGNLPVDQVSWQAASNYCSAIGMRLPTSAEWEYAARGGDNAARYGDLDSTAWYDANSGDTTHPVATKQPNAYGLYDMLGNLWEWVQDDYLKTGKRDKILRGGSFVNIGRDVRVSDLLWADPKLAHRDMGFRCAGE